MEKKQRNSNIELLRVVAMFLIIVYHISFHSIWGQLGESQEFNVPVFQPNLIVLDIAFSFGKIGNVIFILISGYFLVEKGKNIDIAKISKKLFLQLVFAALILTVASTLIYISRHINNFTLINFHDINTMSWFVGYYYVIIVLATFFLNPILQNMDRKNYVKFLAITFMLVQFGWSGDLLNKVFEGARLLLTGIFAYALGGYIKKYEPFKKLRSLTLILIIVATYVIVILSAFNIFENGIHEYLVNGGKGPFYQNIPQFEDHSLMVIVIAVCLFELFTRVNIGIHKWINYLGQATFMVYLIHDNELFYSIWYLQKWIKILYSSPVRFLAKISLWSVGVFIIGVIGYIFFQFITYIGNKIKVIFIAIG